MTRYDIRDILLDIQVNGCIELARAWSNINYQGLGIWILVYKGDEYTLDEEDYGKLKFELASEFVAFVEKGLIK